MWAQTKEDSEYASRRVPGPTFVAGARPIGSAETRHTLLASLAAPIQWCRRWFARETAAAELDRLDDRLLADIGIVRSDIPRILGDALHLEH
jgi:uncharacterized protein YjiS (DUF1127 family)